MDGTNCQSVWRKLSTVFLTIQMHLEHQRTLKLPSVNWYPKLGAGFIVALTGDVMTMPGLPKRPAALNMDVESDGTVFRIVLIVWIDFK